MPARFLFDKKTITDNINNNKSQTIKTGRELILDISAAPGGKSVQIGDYLQYLYNKLYSQKIACDTKKNYL
jgi:hypothetical protein